MTRLAYLLVKRSAHNCFAFPRLMKHVEKLFWLLFWLFI